MADHVKLGGFPMMPGSPYTQPTTWSALGGVDVCLTPNGAKNLDAVEKFIQFLYTDKEYGQLRE